MPACVYHPHLDAEAPCARCGQAFCHACLVEFLGARYCGPCRDVRLHEVQGVSPLQQAPFAGTGTVDMGRWLSAGWQIIQADLVTFSLAVLLAGVVGLFTCGIAAPALACGLYLMTFRKMTTGFVAVENVFDGFRRFLWALLAGLLIGVVAQVLELIVYAPYYAVLFTSKDQSLLLLTRVIGYVGGMIVVAGIGGPTFFVLPLVAARNLNPVEALTASWEVFRRNPFMFCLAAFLFRLLSVVGVFACLIGVVVTTVWIVAAQAQAYVDHFGLSPAELP